MIKYPLTSVTSALMAMAEWHIEKQTGTVDFTIDINKCHQGDSYIMFTFLLDKKSGNDIGDYGSVLYDISSEEFSIPLLYEGAPSKIGIPKKDYESHPKNQNSIRVIHPYLYQGQWVFDDESKGLDKEALVGGTDTIMDILCQSIGVSPSEGLTVLFSDKPFHGSAHEFRWIRSEDGGNVYFGGVADVLEVEGWLCPSLLEYFDQPPAIIYVAVKKTPTDVK
tara:strand:- start:414 stop:1079 length:666 start_codon:yes stop_codon:yes gene_type:complete